MTCPEFESRLSAYLDGELSRWRRWKVETHLRYCSECSRTLRELDEVDGALLTCAQEEATPDYLTAAVMHRLPAMPPAHDARRVWLRRPVGAAFAVVVAGAQVVALGGAYWWGFLHGSDRPHATSIIGAAGTAGGAGTDVRREVSPVSTTSPNLVPGTSHDRSEAPRLGPLGVWTKPDPRYTQPNFPVLREEEEARRQPERRQLRTPLSPPLALPLPVAR